jgi:hypothetical protein
MATNKVRRVEFLGSYFWLIFWTVVFFPVAIFYFVSASVTIEEEIDADKFLEWYRSRKKKK